MEFYCLPYIHVHYIHRYQAKVRNQRSRSVSQAFAVRSEQIPAVAELSAQCSVYKDSLGCWTAGGVPSVVDMEWQT